MKVYKLKADVNNYRCCYLENPNIDRSIKGKLSNEGIEIPVPLKDVDFVYDPKASTPIGDIAACFDIMPFIVSTKCMDILNANEKIKAQFIKTSKNFILLNNLLVLDALDKEKTVYEYCENCIFGVNEFHFMIQDFPPLFQIKISDVLTELDIFVTEEFIKIIEDNNLTGFLFEEVWDSEKE